jgi:GNAT superfamily N-acetyltransferase
MIEIREMRDADVAEGAALAGQLGYPSEELDFARRFRGLSGSPDQGLFVAELEGRVVGMAQVYLHRTLCTEARAEVTGVVVEETSRGQGIGRLLIARAEEWARDRGVELVKLSSNIERSRAHEFYARLGYGRTKTSHLFQKRVD